MPRLLPLALALSSLSLPAQGTDPDPAPGVQLQIPGARKLTIGGQYRVRYEGFVDYDRNRDAGTNTDFFGQRVRLDFGLDFSDELGAFVQLQDARDWGEETSPTLTDDAADGFDLHQGYVDVRATPGVGGATRVGRMEVNLGDQRLVGALDWATGARALDGLLHTWSLEGGSLRVFAFQTREVLAQPAAVPPVPDANDDAQLAGVYYTREFAAGVDGDFYFLHLHDDGTAPGSSANVSTVGTRWVVASSEALSFGAEAATQFGELAGRDVPGGHTFAGHMHGTWKASGDLGTRVTLALDIASGDDPDTIDRERFSNLFPTAHAHWGMMDLALWENLLAPWARVQVSADERTDVALTWLHLESMEATDRFGGPRGVLTTGGTSRHMGEEIDLLYTRRLDWGGPVKSSVQLGYGLFLPGSGGENGPAGDDPAHFVYAQFDVRF